MLTAAKLERAVLAPAVVTQVEQAMTPAELIVIGEVPESPALPTFPIGMPVGI